MNDCARKGKFWNGCRFEPRYDTVPPTLSTMGLDTIKTTVCGMETMIRSMTKEVYVHDVCIRCGKVIERGPQNDERKP